MARKILSYSRFTESMPHLLSLTPATELLREHMLDSCSMEKLESKQQLHQAMECSYADCNDKASSAAIIFGDIPLSIRIRQLRKCDQE